MFPGRQREIVEVPGRDMPFPDQLPDVDILFLQKSVPCRTVRFVICQHVLTGKEVVPDRIEIVGMRLPGRGAGKEDWNIVFTGDRFAVIPAHCFEITNSVPGVKSPEILPVTAGGIAEQADRFRRESPQKIHPVGMFCQIVFSGCSLWQRDFIECVITESVRICHCIGIV